MKFLVSEFIECTHPGVFALVNRNSNKVYITYSRNVLQTVSKIISECQSGFFKNKELESELDQLEFILLESCSSEIETQELKLKHVYWNYYYRDLGYAFYTLYKPLCYTIKLRVVYVAPASARWLVEAINAFKQRIPLGLYKTKASADRFVNTYYPEKVVKGYFVYAINPESLKFFNKKYKHLY